jgi:hypothetical protein
MLSGCVSICADDRVMNGLLTDHISMLDGWMHSWLTDGLQVDGWPRHLCCLIPIMQNNGVLNSGVFSYADVLDFYSEDFRFENWSSYELHYSHFRGIP